MSNSQASSIKKINSYAKERIPFLCLVDFECQQPQVYSIDDLETQKIQFHFPGKSNLSDVVQSSHTPPSLIPTAQSLSAYQKGFEHVKTNLLYGNSFLTNYTTATPVTSSHTLQELLSIGRSKYKILFRNDWLCFSPETFIRIEDGKIYTNPMKGTIDASLPNAEETLMANAKETAEHNTIVDLLRNDLSMVATNVSVSRFRYIDTLQTSHKTLLQCSSEIVGTLPANYMQHLGELFFTLLPAGSISGAPKAKTCQIIQEAEGYKRGYYTGVAFYFDGEKIDSCVLIRFLENTHNGLVYKSGGGITIHSDMKEEYNEMLDKIYIPI